MDQRRRQQQQKKTNKSQIAELNSAWNSTWIESNQIIDGTVGLIIDVRWTSSEEKKKHSMGVEKIVRKRELSPSWNSTRIKSNEIIESTSELDVHWNSLIKIVIAEKYLWNQKKIVKSLELNQIKSNYYRRSTVVTEMMLDGPLSKKVVDAEFVLKMKSNQVSSNGIKLNRWRHCKEWSSLVLLKKK